jgi:hypothetical protein
MVLDELKQASLNVRRRRRRIFGVTVLTVEITPDSLDALIDAAEAANEIAINLRNRLYNREVFGDESTPNEIVNSVSRRLTFSSRSLRRHRPTWRTSGNRALGGSSPMAMAP